MEKKLKFLLLNRSKQQIGQKKYSQKPKKVRLETRGFRATFLLLTIPYGMFDWKKAQILIAHQKQTIDWTKKGRLVDKNSLGQRLKDFEHIFWKLTTPYMMRQVCKILGRQKIINPLGIRITFVSHFKIGLENLRTKSYCQSYHPRVAKP